MSSYIKFPRDMSDLFKQIKPHIPDNFFKIPKTDLFKKINDLLGRHTGNIQLPKFINETPQLKPYYPSSLDFPAWSSVPYGLRQPIYHKIEPLWKQAVITNLPKDPFLNLNRCFNQPKEVLLPSFPAFKVKKIEEPAYPKYDRIKQAMQNCLELGFHKNEFIEINRKLWQVQQLKLPEEFKLEVQDLKDQLEKYQGFQLPAEWMAAEYYCLDQEQFTQKVLDALGDHFFQLKPQEQERLFEDKCFQLAPIHPLVEKYIPSWIIRDDKALGLDLSRFIEAFNHKMALLITHDKLDIFEGAVQLKELFEERINLPGEKLYQFLQTFGQNIDFLDTELTATINELNQKIRIGLDHFGLMVKYYEKENADALYRLLGCLVLPPRASLRPAFDFKATLSGQQVELPYLDFEKIASCVTYNQFVQNDDSSPFSPADFERKSRLIKFTGTPIKNGTMFFVNGILNQEKNIQKIAEFMAKISMGAEMGCLYNASHNFFYDLFQAKLQLGYTSTNSVEALKNSIIEYFEKNGADKQLLLICHSQGAIITRNALMQLPQEIRDRISVAAFGPAAYIDKELCGRVVHFINNWDWCVPYIDYQGLKRCSDTIVRLNSKEKSLWSKFIMGHTIESETYQSVIGDIVKEFVAENQ